MFYFESDFSTEQVHLKIKTTKQHCTFKIQKEFCVVNFAIILIKKYNYIKFTLLTTETS